jgi:glycerate 2-kinase
MARVDNIVESAKTLTPFPATNSVMAKLQVSTDALAIWRSGLEAVRSERLMRESVRVEAGRLVIGSAGEEVVELAGVRRIAVVGAGKAGAGMAAELEAILGEKLAAEKQLGGWVNVPTDCLRELSHIHLHAARGAGENEPTEAGVRGTEEVLRIVGSLGADDLCIALISGGGSALMPAPIEGITLADKLAVTRFLSAAGADIRQLNTVRKQLSRVKAGGLARACRAGRLVTLIISDVPGDPLDLIASGPTVVDSSTAADALAVLAQIHAREAGVPESVFKVLNEKAETKMAETAITCRVSNHIIGNNGTAVEAAGREAVRLGYETTTASAAKPEGSVEMIGRHLVDLAIVLRDQGGRQCFISGGEGTVKLAPESERGLGGRNQQTVLAALIRLAELDPAGIAILSGGTDGEDGPTDAAGAIVDTAVIEEAARRGVDAADFLRRDDAYHFFEPVDGVVKTGPTGTNVCDVRVVVTDG